MNVPLVCPAKIVIVAGTLATPLFELDNVTTVALAAATDSVTVPVTIVLELPLTVFGDTVTVAREGGLSVKVACWELVLRVAVTVAVVVVETDLEVAVNFPVVCPCATDTLPGTETDFVLESSLTETDPLLGPGSALSVTKPTEDLPPTTVDGVNVKAVTSNGFTLSVAVWLTAP